MSPSSSKQPRKISLQTAEGQMFELEEPVAMELAIVKSFLADNDDVTEDVVVPLPVVSGKDISTIIEYCRAHVEFKRRDVRCVWPKAEEVRAFDAAFLENKSNDQLKELAIAANYLDIKELLNLLTDAIAKRIENKSVEYARAYLGIENDFTPAEEAKIRAAHEWAFEGVDED